MKSPPILPFGLLVWATRITAIHLQLLGRRPTFPEFRQRVMSGTTTNLNDRMNIDYLANITLNDAQFFVVVDIGSSDLWIFSSIPGAVSQGIQLDTVLNMTYDYGPASGNVMSATLNFAGFSIDSQFFISAPNNNSTVGGSMGLGPGSASIVRHAANSRANPPLDRIFTSNSSSFPPIIAILLQRPDDPEEPYPGDLAIGEVMSNYSDVLSQPRLPVSLVPLNGGQHWQTFLDVNGIIGPNGEPIEITTRVTGATTQNATVFFDTGFTFPQVPPHVARELYGNIPGAVLDNSSNFGEIWFLPCDQKVNATFLFGGVEFPIHPLDLNFEDGNDGNGQPVCVGAPYSFDIDQNGEILYDMILGVAFLRNAYLLINFGNLVDAATPSTDTAYIQLLPITNAIQAAQDFVYLRGNASVPPQSLASSLSFPRGWLIACVVAFVCLFVLITSISLCCCYRRRKRDGTTSTLTPFVATAPSYQEVHEPCPTHVSPQEVYETYSVSSTESGYTPSTSNSRYTTIHLRSFFDL